MSTTDFDARHETCPLQRTQHTDRSFSPEASTHSQPFDRRRAVMRLIELCERHPLPSMSDEKLDRFVTAIESVLLEE